MAARPLTLRQELFVEYLLGEARFDRVKAAKMAGYSGSPESLRQQAYRLCRDAEVRSRIRERVEAITGDTTAILSELWQVASAPVESFMVVTREALYDQDGNLLRGAQVRQDYSAKVRALELLMRAAGMLSDRPKADVTVKALVGVDISRI